MRFHYIVIPKKNIYNPGKESQSSSAALIMGSAASVDSAALWSEKDVAERVALLGKAFEGYSQSIEDNALDGPTLLSMDEGELDDWFDGIEVKKMHRKRLAKELKEIQSSPSLTAVDSRPTPTGFAPEPEPTPKKGKRFAGFLSHYKRECGTEARLVQDRLKNILPSGQDMFLDSGKSAPFVSIAVVVASPRP